MSTLVSKMIAFWKLDSISNYSSWQLLSNSDGSISWVPVSHVGHLDWVLQFNLIPAAEGNVSRKPVDAISVCMYFFIFLFLSASQIFFVIQKIRIHLHIFLY